HQGAEALHQGDQSRGAEVLGDREGDQGEGEGADARTGVEQEVAHQPPQVLRVAVERDRCAHRGSPLPSPRHGAPPRTVLSAALCTPGVPLRLASSETRPMATDSLSTKAWGIALSTVGADGCVLDAWYPSPRLGEAPSEIATHPLHAQLAAAGRDDEVRGTTQEVVTRAITLADAP